MQPLLKAIQIWRSPPRKSSVCVNIISRSGQHKSLHLLHIRGHFGYPAGWRGRLWSVSIVALGVGRHETRIFQYRRVESKFWSAHVQPSLIWDWRAATSSLFNVLGGLQQKWHPNYLLKNFQALLCEKSIRSGCEHKNPSSIYRPFIVLQVGWTPVKNKGREYRRHKLIKSYS